MPRLPHSTPHCHMPLTSDPRSNLSSLLPDVSTNIPTPVFRAPGPTGLSETNS